MKRIAILKIFDKRSKFRENLKYTRYKTHTLICAGNRIRNIKKLVRNNKDEQILLNCFSGKASMLENCVKRYNDLSTEIVLSVIEKVCREVSFKYELKLPLEEVYLYASPTVAYEFIEKLIGISRIFTVVSNESPTEKADKLYFENGCLIRHIQRPETEKKDALSLFIEKSSASFSPVINATTDILEGKNVVNLREVAVFDNDLKELCNDMDGISGLLLYSLLEKLPGKNAKVDLNKKADDIFLLDTKAI